MKKERKGSKSQQQNRGKRYLRDKARYIPKRYAKIIANTMVDSATIIGVVLLEWGAIFW